MYRYSSVEPNERDKYGNPKDSSLVAIDFGFKNSLFNFENLALRKAPKSTVFVTLLNLDIHNMTRYCPKSTDPLVIDTTKDLFSRIIFINISLIDIDNYAEDSSMFKFGGSADVTFINSTFKNINEQPYNYDPET